MSLLSEGDNELKRTLLSEGDNELKRTLLSEGDNELKRTRLLDYIPAGEIFTVPYWILFFERSSFFFPGNSFDNFLEQMRELSELFL